MNDTKPDHDIAVTVTAPTTTLASRQTVRGRTKQFVLGMLNENEPTTTTDIRKAYLVAHPGVKAPGIPTALSRLLDEGLVRSERGTTTGSAGRPADQWFLTQAGSSAAKSVA